MENLISKLNFYKLIPYLVDRGSPSLPSPLFLALGNGRQQKEEERMRCACAVHRQGDYTATWRVNRTLPVPARAQLRTFFSNVWRDRQGAGQMHLSTR